MPKTDCSKGVRGGANWLLTLFSPCSDNPHLLSVLCRRLNSGLPITGVAVRVNGVTVVDGKDEGVKGAREETGGK